jgi:L-malate glycosyltransferase
VSSSDQRVLFVVKGLGIGGAERFIVQAARWLRIRHVDVTIANLDPRLTSLADECTGLGVDVQNFEIFTWRGPAEFLRLFRLIDRRDVTAIHAHLPWAGFIARLAARMAGRRVIYTEHSLVDRYKLVTRVVNSLSYLGVGANIAVSCAVRDSVARAYGVRASKQMRVIVNPVEDVDAGELRKMREDIRRELGIAKSTLAIGSVASLRPVKRHDLLLDAYASTHKHIPNSILLLVGSGSELGRLKTLARQLGVEDRTKFLGARPDPIRCLAALDIFVLCSDWEGLPLAVLEAMATECAVVATRVGGIPEVVEDGVSGILVDPGDGRHISDALRYLAADPLRRRDLGSNAGRVIRERHASDGVMREYANLYFGNQTPASGASAQR